MKIVGILGPKGAGKSTVSDYLVAKYGAVKYSFAGPLKEIARRTLDFTEDQVYGSQQTKETIDPRYGFSPRWFLQKLGTEGIRAVLGEDIWWERCVEQIIKDRPELAVIEDVRFVNEARGLLDESELVHAVLSLTDAREMKHGTYVWRLEGSSETSDEHQSEAEWSKAPYTHIVKPEKHGLIELYDEVDRVALECGLLRTKLVLA